MAFGTNTGRFKLTLKMIVLTVMVGAAVWAALDLVISRRVTAVFQRQLSEKLARQALQDRLRFDKHLNAFQQLAKIIASQQGTIEYLEKKEWFRSRLDSVAYHDAAPSWFVSSSVMRSLLVPSYTVLLDGEGTPREIYRGSREVPSFLLDPRRILVRKSVDQAHLSVQDGKLYITTAKTIANADGEKVHVMLASPIDDEFLRMAQTDFPDHIVGLLSESGDEVVVSNKPQLIPPGTALEKLKNDYLITDSQFQDYGGAEVLINFASFVAKSSVVSVTRDFVGQGRWQRAVTAVTMILSFVVILLAITRRVARLNNIIENFSRDKLGVESHALEKGDELELLESRFHLLAEEIQMAQVKIKSETEEKMHQEAELERKGRLSELLQSVTDAVGVGILIREDGVLKPTNRQMERYAKIFGGTGGFHIEGGSSDVRIMKDLHGVEYIFSIASHTFPSGEQVILVRDITKRRRAVNELRASELRYRSLFEDSRDAIYITSRDGTLLQANRATLEMFGYSSEELIGKNVVVLYVMPAERIPFQKAIEKSGSVRDYAIAFRKKDGTTLDGVVTATVRRDREDAVIGYQGIIRDVTEKRQIEKEIMRVEKLESVGLLAGGIAHDFNNILQAILTNINIATLLAPPDGKLKNHLAEAEKASLRAHDLTMQLLTYARGGAPMRRDTPIADLIRESAGFALRGSNITCEFNFSERLWQAKVDEGQLVQVINNLVMNAQQAMPDGGSISTRAENAVIRPEDNLPLKEGRYVKIAITDRGKGIERENLERVFDPFFTTKSEGSGLGLAVVYSIVKNHEGYISIESNRKEGTTFTVYLPASEWEVADKRRQGETLPFFSGSRVLLMDDDEGVLESIGQSLRLFGYEVVSAVNGEEAIKHYRAALSTGRPFEALIIDLTIPGGMSGRETIEKLLEIDPRVKAIVSSGYSTDPVIADYRSYGFRGVLIKPYTTSELNRVLRSVIDAG